MAVMTADDILTVQDDSSLLRVFARYGGYRIKVSSGGSLLVQNPQSETFIHNLQLKNAFPSSVEH